VSEEVAQSARFGLVALVGRPNVGKSTLMNRLVGQKLSIVTRRPQTTRHRILGVLTLPEAQVAFVDTPGMHLNRRGALNQYMNRTAEGALDDMDLVLFMVEAGRWTDEDANVLARIKDHGARAALVVNKMDRLKSRTQLLPYLQQRAGDHNYSEVIPISAERGDNVDRLLETLVPYMPEGPAQFPPDQVTDRSVRFLSAEAVREKLTRRLGDELPYGLGVEIEEFEELPHVTRIGAVIWLEKTSHKPIVIGKKGLLLKDVGIEARVDLEQLLEKKIYLRLWVKVREGWSDSERLLQRLGYHD
jgi:GTP-binding protein Era